MEADSSYLREVSIPNKEIAVIHKNEILSHLLQIRVISRATANVIAESLYTNDIQKLPKAISSYIDKSIRFYDAGAEGFYHSLMLRLVALLDSQYQIKSNRESGDGRYDICLRPREKKYPGIIMELKWKSGLQNAELKVLSSEALRQIEEKRYTGVNGGRN